MDPFDVGTVPTIPKRSAADFIGRPLAIALFVLFSGGLGLTTHLTSAGVLLNERTVAKHAPTACSAEGCRSELG